MTITGMTALLRYPLLIITVLVGVLGAVLGLAGVTDAPRLLFSVFGLAVVGIQSVDMVKKLRQGTVGIDLLAIMAVVATIAVGEYVATMIIILMLTGGQALEDYAAGRATRELTALLTRAPQIAHRLSDAPAVRIGTRPGAAPGAGPDVGLVVDIPATEVQPGDLILVRPSEIVPVDGDLHSDQASFDESSLTGESLPVERTRGDPVLSGSVNGQAAAVIRATASAENSQYQRIIALVEEAAGSKAPVVRLADRYAVPFTLLSLGIAGLAWWASGDPVRFAEVLVVATPCPLLLAAPVAFMGGMSRAARNGIIVKGAGVLETLSRARTVVFDKTGTLTAGTPTITDVRAVAPFTPDELLGLAASAEQYSSHVLAASVIAAARERGLTLTGSDSASEVATNGVLARVADRDVAVGKLALIRTIAPAARATAQSGGELAIYVAVDGAYAGCIVASDKVRPDARDTLQELARLGVHETVMLTGDAQATAEHIAAEVGITRVLADCLPGDKVDVVRSLEQRPVIMVGDGVNDAPVLAVADVGIAMGARGSTAASESADIVILLDDIGRTARAVRIGADTVRIALQSIWIGIVLSVVLMVVAAFGLIPATVGALSQEAVDLITILNALRAIGGPADVQTGGGRR